MSLDQHIAGRYGDRLKEASDILHRKCCMHGACLPHGRFLDGHAWNKDANSLCAVMITQAV